MTHRHAVILLALFAVTPASAQQANSSIDPKLSDRDNIKAVRAKALADEAKEGTARPWDKERAGKRNGETGKAPEAAVPVAVK